MSEKVRIALTINGGRVVREVDPSLSLLRFLREDLGLVGAKNGCEKGHCGACTVIVDGAARRACLLKASRLEGSAIQTIEGLTGPDGSPHPLQRAFVLEGAVQCGFCTPGMIMAAKALLDRAPDPSEAEMAEAMRDNMCRCTGYAAIRRAIARAARELGGRGGVETPPRGAVGAALPRKDAPAKARGEALFSEDLADRGAPGAAKALVGKMLFSERSHARLRSVDTAKASAAEGVALVLTARDVPGRSGSSLSTRSTASPDSMAASIGGPRAGGTSPCWSMTIWPIRRPIMGNMPGIPALPVSVPRPRSRG